MFSVKCSSSGQAHSTSDEEDPRIRELDDGKGEEQHGFCQERRHEGEAGGFDVHIGREDEQHDG